MKGQLKVATPAQYMAKLKEPRKSDVAALDQLIRKATKLQPYIQSGMLAYGHCRLKYAGGRAADWFRIGVASNATYISLYLTATDGKQKIAERYQQALPKADIGRSCVRFKRLGDLDQVALKKMIREGVRRSGEAWPAASATARRPCLLLGRAPGVSAARLDSDRV